MTKIVIALVAMLATADPYDDTVARRVADLRSGDERLVAATLQSYHETEFSPELAEIEALVAYARDPGADRDLRVAALRVLEEHQRPELDEAARFVAGHHDDPYLAHEAARVLVSSWDDDGDALTANLDSPVRAVREECALRTDRGVPILIEAALDDDELPRFRGEAVAALGKYDTPEVHAALVRLLEPAHWFWGARLRNNPVHGLGFVIDALREQPHEGDRKLLQKLAKQIAALPEDEREFVEERLVSALAQKE